MNICIDLLMKILKFKNHPILNQYTDQVIGNRAKN